MATWLAYEVVERHGEKDRYPVSEELARSGKVPKKVLQLMKLACAHGWPEAKTAMKDQNGKARIVDKGGGIWLLKCKPECWRLYFYVHKEKEENGFAYVNAVCKKRDAEDPGSAERAKRVVERIRSGNCNLTIFPFPA